MSLLDDFNDEWRDAANSAYGMPLPKDELLGNDGSLETALDGPSPHRPKESPIFSLDTVESQVARCVSDHAGYDK